MNGRFDAAVEEARRQRLALRATLAALRSRAKPAQVAEELLILLDPDLTYIGHIRGRMRRNKLLSFAVLAGAAW
uniref:hypothetical protein n=1 Tax=Novosphingobium sp. TaxID=1874826 RepID=UPI0035B219A8